VTPPGKGWNEENLSENPAIEHLGRLGWIYVRPEDLDVERESLKQVVLIKRLSTALKKLNPWLSDDNLHRAVRAVTGIQSTSLIEASEKLYTTLTYGIALEQDLGDGSGKKNRPVQFFDFDDPTRNEFVVTRQFKVRGTKKHIIPDLMLFVNGIPLGIIECKSPTLGDDWKREALDQFSRYQESEDRYRELGTPKLFETIQVLVATCGQAAVYGTVLTPHRFFVEWKTPYPRGEADLERDLGRKPNAQEILFEGMLPPASFLDLVRNFVVFERDAKTGRTVRKLCRYQQFAAVNKAIDRARNAKNPTDRGGVVWHTQGSGKSLTMLWLALKLRRDPTHENPTLVIVTDRKDLDEQIAKTFVACGFPNPDQAESVRDLRELLSGPSGKTILTTVQKFQEVEGRGDASKRRVREEYPLLSTATNIFVLADEAHRTQYGGLAANLRKALPNACFFGFSGTPIDKKDRSTRETFGPYIDTYTIEQAVADGATVPIYYEGRLAELRIIGNTLDAVFDRVFADRTEEEREAIKKKYGRESAIAGAPKRVERICLDIIEHYTTHIQPGGFKAQIVAVNRETAVLYKETLDRLQGPQSALVISASNKDDEKIVRHHLSEEQRKDVIARFCKPSDQLSILVVCDMLLTGFDAPVEQVMYLDAPLREHTLLQAIARVNRVSDKKDYGLIVDYWGVSESLQEALAIFAPSDIKGAMTPKSDELPRLQARHAAVLRFFVRVKDKDDLEACVVVLEPEDVRAEFDQAFRRFAESLDMILPDAAALPYVGDARWFGKIRASAAARYRDGKIDVSDCGAKVQKLIEEAVIAEGIQILVKQVSLFTPEFEQKLAALKSDEARASEMEHAIKSEIHVKLEEDPAFYSSLRERLEKLIEDRKAKRFDAAQQLKLFEALRGEMRGRADVAQSLGMSETSFAIYGLIADPRPSRAAEASGAGYAAKVDESKKELAGILEEQLEAQVTIVDWVTKDDVQKEMRRVIKRQLRAAGFAPDKIDPTAESVVDLMKRRRGR
jgi:type I restriction enzyme, R subunit